MGGPAGPLVNGTVAAPAVDGSATAVPGRRRDTTLRATIAGRLAGAVIVLWAAFTATFVALQFIPGKIEDIMAGDIDYPGLREAIRADWGLDEPLLTQYFQYLGRLSQGDLGRSYVRRQEVTELLTAQIGSTVELAVAAGVLACAAAILVSVFTAGRNRFVRSIFSAVEVVANSVPVFWFGLLLLLAFSFNLKLFPVSGAKDLSSLVLPALTLALPTFGLLTPVLRDGMERALEQPFAVTALSRGIGESRLRVRHALRHGLVPTVTLAGWLVAHLLGGAVITETVFGRPGLGTLALQAVMSKDVPVVLAIVLIVAAIYVVISTIVDITYALIDPRLKAAR
ncbi:ABC transporter permease [Nocardia sp. NBC_00416]|uniref:ABC transporter permease n=1 Tax=Nocardia sp. NBC_00416 TaxID=2975991 RepID=UPI002E20E308